MFSEKGDFQEMEQNQKLNAILRTGETLRWTGAPVGFPMLDSENKRGIILRWVITALLFALFCGYYMRGDFNWGVVGLVTLICVCIVAAPFVESRSVSKLRYWITNQRAIVALAGDEFYSIDLSKIDEFKIITDHDGKKTLVMGSCIYEDAKKQLRWRACHPKVDTQTTSARGSAQGLIFYASQNTDSAAALLRDAASPARQAV